MFAINEFDAADLTAPQAELATDLQKGGQQHAVSQKVAGSGES